MKQQNSPPDIRDRIADMMDYSIHGQNKFPFFTLKEGADSIGVSPQRMSRILRVLEIKVHRIGHLILLDQEAIDKAREAITNRVIRPGPKLRKKTSA